MVTASTHSLSFAASIHQNSISGRKDRKPSSRNVGWTRRVGKSLPDPDDIVSIRPLNSNSSPGNAFPGSPRWSNQVGLSRVNTPGTFYVESIVGNNCEHCNCGVRNELSFSRKKASRAVCLGSRKDGDNGCLGKERKKRKTMSLDAGGKMKMLRPPHAEIIRGPAGRNFESSSSAESANEGNVVRNLSVRFKGCLIHRTCSFLSPLARWKSIAGAVTAAGLSFTICSSAVADTMATAHVLPVDVTGTTLISEGLPSCNETKTRQEPWTHLKLQRNRLEEATPPMSQWTIDDCRQTLKEMPTLRLDDHGRGNVLSTVDIEAGQLVPTSSPAAAPLTTERAFGSGSAKSGGDVDNRINSSSAGISLAGSLIAGPASEQAIAASRTVGSVASVSALHPSATAVPGVSLLTRLIMHFSGGGVAGAIGATLVYPLDTIKTRMQAQSDKTKKGHYDNEWDCFLQMVTKEGPGSLYSGLLPQLVGIAPEKAMKLTVNDVLMEMLESELPGVRDWALELVAGGGGGFCQVIFTNPMEIVKVRLQTQSKDAKQKNAGDVIKELGLQGLYNGSIVTIIRDVPSTAIFFAMYSLMRQFFPDQSFMAGFVAAIPATVLVTPFDVVKTRMQMEQNGQEVAENAYSCFMNIMRNEGVGALFKGSLARVLKTSPQFGLTLMLYNILSSASPLDIAMAFFAPHMNVLEATTKLNTLSQ